MPRDAANRWNRLRYTLWAPVYDAVAGFARQRRRAIELLAVRPGERVLIVGAGTGADLPYLPEDVDLVAVDLTPAMVRRAAARAAAAGRPIDLHVMDAHALEFEPASFDAIVLHLILAVVPDPDEVLRQAARVLRPTGRAVVFDKFARDAGPLSWRRRIANRVTAPLATDVTRRLGPLIAASPFEIVRREDAGFGGFFQIATLRRRRPASSGTATVDGIVRTSRPSAQRAERAVEATEAPGREPSAAAEPTRRPAEGASA
jgi:ubiquinone/menaquinone biosynthesis C-methylase UbiE